MLKNRLLLLLGLTILLVLASVPVSAEVPVNISTRVLPVPFVHSNLTVLLGKFGDVDTLLFCPEMLINSYTCAAGWKVYKSMSSSNESYVIFNPNTSASFVGGKRITAEVPKEKPQENVTLPAEKLKLGLSTKKMIYQFDEIPEFDFEYESASNASEPTIQGEEFAINSWSSANEKIEAYLYLGEKKIDLPISMEQVKAGKLKLTLPQIREMRAGTYRLEIRYTKEGAESTYSQDFIWGVLAINTHKSIYLSGENAKIDIGVLDLQGRTVCDADVVLEITAPDGGLTRLTTAEGSINRSEECLFKGRLVYIPDYSASYNVGGAGNYSMKLTATTQDGTYSIDDFFLVQDNVPFDVERQSVTRINPIYKYETKIIVKANQDYAGPIVEKIPLSFEVTSDGKVQTKQGEKEIQWNVNLKAGESTTLAYEFDAPDISPLIFLVGPLEIGNWQEAREWKIASDAPDTNNGAIAYRSATGSCASDKLNCPKYRTWNASSLAWNAELELPTADSQVRFAQLEFSDTSVERVIVTMSDDGYLDSYVCKATDCTQTANWVVTNNIAQAVIGANTTATRPYDIAFEAATGDLLLVYDKTSSSATQDLFYRVLPAGATSVWGAEGNFNYLGDSANDANFTFVRLVNSKINNNIGIMAIDATTSDAVAWVWNGTTNAVELENVIADTVAITTEEAIGIAYERSSGDLIAVAGIGTTMNYSQMTYSTRTWGANTTFGTIAIGTINWVSLQACSVATSNEIFAGETGSLSDMDTQYWSGSAWTDGPEHDAAVDGHAARVFDFAWNPSADGTGTTVTYDGILVWGTATGSLSYRTFNATATFNATTFPTATETSTHSWVQLASPSNPTAADTIDVLGATLDTTFDIGGLKGSGTIGIGTTGDGGITADTIINGFESFDVEWQLSTAAAPATPNNAPICGAANMSAYATVTITEAGYKTYPFNFTVLDVDGADTLVNASAEGNWTLANQPNMINQSCAWESTVNSTAARYQCRMKVPYYTAPGSYSANVTIEDSSGASCLNTANAWTVSTTTSFSSNVSALAFPQVTATSTNTLANNDPILLNNTGNKNSTTVKVNATDLRGVTTCTEASCNSIGANRFTAKITDACEGTALVNMTPTTVTSAVLWAGPPAVTNSLEQLFVCLEDLPALLLPQGYSTNYTATNYWIISVA